MMQVDQIARYLEAECRLNPSEVRRLQTLKRLLLNHPPRNCGNEPTPEDHLDPGRTERAGPIPDADHDGARDRGQEQTSPRFATPIGLSTSTSINSIASWRSCVGARDSQFKSRMARRCLQGRRIHPGQASVAQRPWTSSLTSTLRQAESWEKLREVAQILGKAMREEDSDGDSQIVSEPSTPAVDDSRFAGLDGATTRSLASCSLAHPGLGMNSMHLCASTNSCPQALVK